MDYLIFIPFGEDRISIFKTGLMGSCYSPAAGFLNDIESKAEFLRPFLNIRKFSCCGSSVLNTKCIQNGVAVLIVCRGMLAGLFDRSDTTV